MMSKTILLLLALTFGNLTISAQSEICQSAWGYDDNCILSLQNGQVIFSDFGSYPEIILSYDGNRVYQGATMFGSDCLFTIFGDNVFHGPTTMRNECAYTVLNDRIYRGNSFNDADCIWTIYNGIVYKGSSTSSMDQVFKVYDDSGDLTNHLLACILSAYE
jgi:hypothetical protein